MSDHYRTLGVPPNADGATVRAAYIGLMRQYHPDQNGSADAAERTKEVSAAYRVLGNADAKNAYDRGRTMHPSAYPPPVRKPLRRGRTAFLLIAAGTGSLVYYALSQPIANVSPVWPRSADPAGTADPTEAAELAMPEREPGDPCGEPVDLEAVKRDLFQRAAASPSADGARLAQSAALATVRLSPLVREGSEFLGTSRCHATATLRLPPGSGAADGRQVLLADLWFAPAGKSGTLELQQGELLSGSLAELMPRPGSDGEPAPLPSPPQARPQPPAPSTRIAQARPMDPPVRMAQASPPRSMIAPALPRPAPLPRPQAAALPTAKPPNPVRAGSARTAPAATAPAAAAPAATQARVNLAALDTHLARLYNQSFLYADAGKRSRLVSTRNAFTTRFGRCATDICRRDAYLARNQEIAAIMRG